MSSQVCGKCDKTVYATEKVEAAQKWYHKGCFKCNDPHCNIQLTLKTFQVVNDNVWCGKHAPKPNATYGLDTVQTQHALSAPKKTTEGLHKIQVGTGESPTYGLDTVQTQHALSAPKKQAENLHKVQVGTGEQYSYGLNTLQTQHALNAPKKQVENIGHVKKGDGSTVPRSVNDKLSHSQEELYEDSNGQDSLQEEIAA
ncbi:uncharacterized protein SPPG_05041 [Spizellomyces punctatus DAOM BR117]|uniref:LIM zinc-binding domain-containing protein n=1 Tax=Spizellomyces punctatus (strain DAOM BR117) TaxID=645134 RepID=A0A0L0HFH6_SPIPD|nr:uncharacterized protein SPPG_05041 [Spizellomyces punctatus DAOM BR117]KNC99659.1 hypothetical protein SPPG_05041 [Spizellomyces punctatus DAOM BR117]|eukprot:XP_016607699.1 hypothetical protein SPPG_05041 [Spizellomyces punctatus DAOM BR117]